MLENSLVPGCFVIYPLDGIHWVSTGYPLDSIHQSLWITGYYPLLFLQIFFHFSFIAFPLLFLCFSVASPLLLLCSHFASTQCVEFHVLFDYDAKRFHWSASRGALDQRLANAERLTSVNTLQAVWSAQILKIVFLMRLLPQRDDTLDKNTQRLEESKLSKAGSRLWNSRAWTKFSEFQTEGKLKKRAAATLEVNYV